MASFGIGVCGSKVTRCPGGLPAMIARPLSQRSWPCLLWVTQPLIGLLSVLARLASTPAFAVLSQVAPANSRRSSGEVLQMTISWVPERTSCARPLMLTVRRSMVAPELVTS